MTLNNQAKKGVTAPTAGTARGVSQPVNLGQPAESVVTHDLATPSPEGQVTENIDAADVEKRQSTSNKPKPVKTKAAGGDSNPVEALIARDVANPPQPAQSDFNTADADNEGTGPATNKPKPVKVVATGGDGNLPDV